MNTPAIKAPEVPLPEPAELIKRARNDARLYEAGWLPNKQQHAAMIRQLADALDALPAGARAGDGKSLADAFELFQRLEDAASQALTDANNAGKVANRPGIHIQSIKSAGELGNAIVAVKQAYRALLAAAPAVSAPANREPLSASEFNDLLAGVPVHHKVTAYMPTPWVVKQLVERAHGIPAPVTAGSAE
ncbi:hypothetical protein [Roseateles sp. P5_E11]